MKGLFVTFEGIDGCGKSTQVDAARRGLEQKGIACTVTREPGGAAISEQVREILLSPGHHEMCNACEVLLNLAARAQHVHEKIAPALDKGAVVLCDRFMDATFAYQSFGRGIPLDLLFTMNDFATGGIAPALTFVFDIDVETAFGRLAKAKKTPDRLEQSGREFYEKVRRGYRALASRFSRRIVVLDGAAPAEELSARVLANIMQRLPGKQ